MTTDINFIKKVAVGLTALLISPTEVFTDGYLVVVIFLAIQWSRRRGKEGADYSEQAG